MVKFLEVKIETEIMCGLPKTDALLEVNSCKSAEDYYDDIHVSICKSFENSGWSWYVYEDSPLAGKYKYPVSFMGMTDWVNLENVNDGSYDFSRIKL